MSQSNSEAVCDASIGGCVLDASSPDCIRSHPIALPGEVPVFSWRYRHVKRALDLIGAALMLTMFVIPGLLIAVMILFTSPGPVFYREERLGRDGSLFRIWKFRSMYKDAPQKRWLCDLAHNGNRVEWRMRKDLRDPRVTPVGHYLRRWSLDELPQLLNVLFGDMSLVGPRPIVEDEASFYGGLLPIYLAANPGMSGLWQTSGRSKVGYERRVQMDAMYVQNWSLVADLRILLRTVPAVLSHARAS